jgi:hypothetical protein
MAKKKTARSVVDAAAAAATHIGELGTGFALIGGLAVRARGEPRYTRDVDLAVSVDDDEEAERPLYALTIRVPRRHGDRAGADGSTGDSPPASPR